MKHILKISLMEVTAADRWAEIARYTTPANVAGDVVFCGGEMQPGYVFDEYAVDMWLNGHKLPEFAEAILGAINESNERHGVYWTDANEGAPAAIAVEWSLVHQLAADDPTGASKLIPLKDASEDGDRVVNIGVTVENHNLGLCLKAQGYGCYGCYDAGPVFLEVYEGRLRLIVWDDISREDPTHIIDLEGARDVQDQEQARESLAVGETGQAAADV